MKRVGRILLLMLFGVSTKAQNLVPNPSFEEYIQCPQEISDFEGFVSNWFQPSSGTSDYFNSCGGNSDVGVPSNFKGHQVAKNGQAYAGFFCYSDVGYREYVETQLFQALEVDTVYCIEFYIVRASIHSSSATSSLGAYFSVDTVYEETGLELGVAPSIQNELSNLVSDTLNWTRISGEYLAEGGEQFLTIGNFFDNSQTPVVFDTLPLPQNQAYYYIDEVSVMKCSQVGTSVQSVAQQVNVQLNPNPVSSELQLTLNGFTGETQLDIFNLIGQRVFTNSFTPTHKTFHQVVDVSSLPSGLYFVSVSSSGQHVAKKIVKQ